LEVIGEVITLVKANNVFDSYSPPGCEYSNSIPH